MDFFVLRDDLSVELNREEILLVKEFNELFSLKFNTGENGDKDGRKRLRAFKVMSYIYLVYDWKSPYAEYSNKERHETALLDADIKEDALKNDTVRNAVNKYLEIQDTRITKLLKSAHRVVDELRLYFETVDLTERDVNDRPVFTAKDLMNNLSALGKTVESLQHLEYLVKKEKDQDKGLRGDAEPGMFD